MMARFSSAVNGAEPSGGIGSIVPLAATPSHGREQLRPRMRHTSELVLAVAETRALR